MELEAIKRAGDYLSAMIGSGEEETDKEFTKVVKHIDKMLKKNNHKRDFK
jgi:hypothetical protein